MREREMPRARELLDLGYPDYLVSIDGKETFDTSEVYTGIKFFKKYSSTHEKRSLDLACTHGCYNALKERCAINANILKDDNATENEKDAARKQLLGDPDNPEKTPGDLEMIATFYWSAGCMFASNVTLDLARYYKKKSSEVKIADGEEDPYAAIAHAYLGKAATMYIRARTLYEHDHSQWLANLVYKGDLTLSGYKSFEAADKDILENGSLDKDAVDIIRKRENTSIHDMLEGNHHPRLHHK